MAHAAAGWSGDNDGRIYLKTRTSGDSLVKSITDATTDALKTTALFTWIATATRIMNWANWPALDGAPVNREVQAGDQPEGPVSVPAPPGSIVWIMNFAQMDLGSDTGTFLLGLNPFDTVDGAYVAITDSKEPVATTGTTEMSYRVFNMVVSGRFTTPDQAAAQVTTGTITGSIKPPGTGYKGATVWMPQAA